jgi:hypothetical protein
MKNRRAEPLKVLVKDGALTVSVGVEALAWGFERCQECQPYDEETGRFKQILLVTDPDGFAKEVRHEFENESEDGTTPLSDFLDRMCMSAVEAGSIYIEETGTEIEDKSFDERAKDWATAAKRGKKGRK